MVHSDPVADMLTRIRNALLVEQSTVSMPSSKIKVAIAEILKEEGYVNDFEVVDDKPAPILRVTLKYYGSRRERRPVISGLERVSKPGRRVYAGKDEIPWVRSGMGTVIMSTPQGLMTGHKARRLGIGGEVLCKVW